MSQAIRQALYTKLTGESSITSKLATSSSVFHGHAPPDSPYPFIIINKQSKGRTRAQSETVAFEDETWLIKAVDRSSSSTVAEAISEAVESTLTNGTLTVTGRTLHDLFPTGDVDYIENQGDQQFRHHGALYKITTS